MCLPGNLSLGHVLCCLSLQQAFKKQNYLNLHVTSVKYLNLCLAESVRSSESFWEMAVGCWLLQLPKFLGVFHLERLGSECCFAVLVGMACGIAAWQEVFSQLRSSSCSLCFLLKTDYI